MNCSPLYNSERAQTRQMQALAEECVISSSLVLVAGVEGSGRRHFGDVLERRHQKGFPWKMFRYECTTTTRREALFRDMLDDILGETEGRRSSAPNLIKQCATALQASETSLLFLYNAHCLCDEDREDLYAVARRVRQHRPFGVIMTVYEDQLTFQDFMKNPRALAEIHLKPLTVVENLNGLYAHDARFKPWLDRFEAKNRDVEVAELADLLRNYTDGNFERLASFCRSIKHHITGAKLELEDINLVMRKREGKTR